MKGAPNCSSELKGSNVHCLRLCIRESKKFGNAGEVDMTGESEKNVAKFIALGEHGE